MKLFLLTCQSISKRCFLTVHPVTVVHDVIHDPQNTADHIGQRSGTGLWGSGTGFTGQEQTVLCDVRTQEAQQSSRR